MNNKYCITFYLLILNSCFTVGLSQDSIKYRDLVDKLYDLESLATIPRTGEYSGNFSSYDRRSKYDAATNTYIQWDANGDGSGFIRKEGEDIVIFDKNGPGVIWRFWSALAKEGNIKIFIDHSEIPVVDQPFRDFFEKFGNDIPPINFPNLVMTLSRGRNHYLPIPYNKHCKIVLSKNWGAYYHITFTSYPETTIMPSYSGRFSKEDCLALAQADRFLSNRGYSRKIYDRESIEKFSLAIGSNQAKLIASVTGNEAITCLKFKYDNLSEYGGNIDFLKDLWLSITWDSDKEPSVLAPLGMFFGTSPGSYHYRSLPLGLIGDVLYSDWFMPFSEKASLTLINKGNKSYKLQCIITHAPLKESANNLLRFHALWNNGKAFLKSNKLDDGRSINWPFLMVSGKGRFCGVSLHIENRWDEPEKVSDDWWYGKWNKKSIDWWWGEGDEKFFVDGEKFPSTFGTGSEDYIGYAWSAEPPFPVFDSPFACQPYTPINGNGHTIVSRFHIADNIPFQVSFEGCIEKYKKDKWGENNSSLYDATVYWYQMPIKK